MKKQVKFLIIILILILISIFVLLVLNNKKEISQDAITYKINVIYLNDSKNLNNLILNSDKIGISTGCNSIFAFIYFFTGKEGDTIYYDVYTVINQDLVRNILTLLNPSYLPGFEQKNMIFYGFDQNTKRFEIDTNKVISNTLNLSQFCPPEKPIEHATITSNFSIPVGYIDEDGNLRRY